MELPLTMNKTDLLKTALEVDGFNKGLRQAGRKVSGTLGKDDFLRLLVVQLQHQDPTNPLDDKEFIAQMAQFSALEQMTQMNGYLEKMIDGHRSNLTYSLLGRQVEVLDERTGQAVSGVVSEIEMSGGEPRISFDGLTYSVDEVTRVSLAGAGARPPAAEE